VARRPARLRGRIRHAVLVPRRGVLLARRPAVRSAVLLAGRGSWEAVLMAGRGVLLARRATERPAILLARWAVVRMILLARRSGAALSGRSTTVVSRGRGRKRVPHRRKDSE
jgi:hypothetical protein